MKKKNKNKHFFEFYLINLFFNQKSFNNRVEYVNGDLHLRTKTLRLTKKIN